MLSGTFPFTPMRKNVSNTKQQTSIFFYHQFVCIFLVSLLFFIFLEKTQKAPFKRITSKNIFKNNTNHSVWKASIKELVKELSFTPKNLN